LSLSVFPMNPDLSVVAGLDPAIHAVMAWIPDRAASRLVRADGDENE